MTRTRPAFAPISDLVPALLSGCGPLSPTAVAPPRRSRAARGARAISAGLKRPFPTLLGLGLPKSRVPTRFVPTDCVQTARLPGTPDTERPEAPAPFRPGVPLRGLLTCAVFVLPATARAAGFERPIPQPQTEAAELWFLIASIALIVALAAVQWLVSRR
ncbi:hypothetical protein EKE94_04880 [Mesobaculum littorinae]|uniref:Protein NnrT n=1 Tax=Mesobaculum littorinae TaxID=2486419 RepID=A0A438AHZ0_9RHOB|nr:hypothetical protein [Mesobaculum littorinae]RVV98268.1 hypothetical protein EKE94_04880 [Mesobaculum littorinae]